MNATKTVVSGDNSLRATTLPRGLLDYYKNVTHVQKRETTAKFCEKDRIGKWGEIQNWRSHPKSVYFGAA